ncbi:L-asparaginase [Exaiptasia diaphana]|nr:L-asparaginase [Exaiptasia diaphana]
MKKTESGYQPKLGFLQEQIKRLPMLFDQEYVNDVVDAKSNDDLAAEASEEPETKSEFTDEKLEEIPMPVSIHGVRILYYIKDYDPIKDSSNLTIEDWVTIALDIKKYYKDYNGIIVIHGTDTMSYTASALSFMLENLGKTVILTGSQVPIYEQRNDGRDNLLGALMFAGHYIIPEVCIYFNGRLYRGNRTTKVNAGSFNAFDSPNLPPLATMKVKIDVLWDAIFRCNNNKALCVHTHMNPNVGLLRLFPGITVATVKAFLQEPMQGVVLQTYGSGNAPNNRDDIISEFKKATERGVIIVNCTQCIRGVVVDDYATGRNLLDAGVIPGSDMTPEAALTKLSYILSHKKLTDKEKRELIKQNLRGELTVAQSQEQFSLVDSEFIEAVALSLHVGSSEEMKYIRRALLPVLMCSAASSGSVSTLEKLLQQGADPNGSVNYDGRRPLHISCMSGNMEVTEYLLSQGASVHARDMFNRTPLDDAIKFRKKAIVNRLVQAGAILNKKSTEIAGEICSLAAKNRVDDLGIWTLAGADLNVCDYDGRTPLHIAVCRNNIETIKFLLDNGVDVSIRDIFDNTALDNAKSQDLENVVKLFNDYIGMRVVRPSA